MKPSFVFVFVFANLFTSILSRSFLDGPDGEGQDDNVDESLSELQHEAAEMTAVAAEFKHRTMPLQSKRLKTLKVALEPMFKSLPKNRQGKLVPQVARYALHRLFEQQHSWSVNGIRPVRSAQEEDIFGQMLAVAASDGSSIDNLAVLAAIIESRIHEETVSQLNTSYEALGHDVNKDVSPEELDRMVQRYMTIYISGMREYNLTQEELAEQTSFMETSTLDWQATMQWVHNAEQTAVRAKKPCGHGITDCSFDSQSATYVVEELVKGYGQFNHGECKRLKETLLKMGDRQTGRVSLADFYKEGMSGTWEFNEKVDYLRDLGTLDESLPGKPRVIVTNYVNSWVNCLTSSSLYSVCCRNECEDLMGHLERSIESSTASPDRILKIVRNFQSDDFPVAADISTLLSDRLHQIAEKHNGVVPLHGRLFSQWLHHVFPQSCPYPHAAGATNPLTPDEWMKENGHSGIKASPDEIMEVVNKVAIDVRGGVHSNPVKLEDQSDNFVPWSDVEEVFVIHESRETEQDSRFFGLDMLIMWAQGFVGTGLLMMILRATRLRRPVHKSLACDEKLVI